MLEELTGTSIGIVAGLALLATVLVGVVLHAWILKEATRGEKEEA